jgi:hypothetical protein
VNHTDIQNLNDAGCITSGQRRKIMPPTPEGAFTLIEQPVVIAASPEL